MLVSFNERYLMIILSEGVRAYTFPDFCPMETTQVFSDFEGLAKFSSKKFFVFDEKDEQANRNLKIFFFDFLKFFNRSCNFEIGMNPDGRFVFTIGEDNTLNKWCTIRWSVVKKVSLPSRGACLIISKERKSVLVGMENGQISEVSIDDLSILRTVKEHRGSVTRIIETQSKELISCSQDGCVRFVFAKKKPLRVSKKGIASMAVLEDGRVACVCDDKVRVISIASDVKPIHSSVDSSEASIKAALINEDSKRLLSDEKCREMIDSFSKSLESIRSSSSALKPQLIDLLRHYLCQLEDRLKPQPSGFTGLSLSLCSSLATIRRSHLVLGCPENRVRTITKDCSIDLSACTPDSSTSKAKIHLFDRKLLVFGSIDKSKSVTDSFKIKEVRRGNWIFKMSPEISLPESQISGSAEVELANGTLHCYIIDGQPLAKDDFQSTLLVDGIVKKVIAVGFNGVVVTSEGKTYAIDFKRNKIESLGF